VNEPERPISDPAETIESPCIDVCVIDPETGLCRGCARTLEEIAAWTTYTPAERRRITLELGQRDARPST
jgi:uncharacterized protein